LDSNVAALEAELKQANEKLTQLNHELAKKTELIQILTNDVDESGSESGIFVFILLTRVQFVCIFFPLIFLDNLPLSNVVFHH
jgi:trafficking kinesin-binding protein 1